MYQLQVECRLLFRDMTTIETMRREGILRHKSTIFTLGARKLSTPEVAGHSGAKYWPHYGPGRTSGYHAHAELFSPLAFAPAGSTAEPPANFPCLRRRPSTGCLSLLAKGALARRLRKPRILGQSLGFTMTESLEDFGSSETLGRRASRPEHHLFELRLRE